MANLGVLTPPRTHVVPVVDESGVTVGALNRAELARVFTSPDNVLARRVEDLLRDHHATATWRVEADNGLVTISGTFQATQRWSLMSLMRLVPGVEGLVLRATPAPRIRLD